MLTLSYFAIIIVSLVLLLLDKTPISLRQVFYSFSIIFYGTAGYIQEMNGFLLAPMYQDLTDADYFKANCVILFSIAIYETIYRFTFNKKPDIVPIQEKNMICKKRTFCFYLLFAIYIFLYINAFSVQNVILRGGGETKMVFSSTAGLLFNPFRFTFVASAAFYYISKNRNKVVSYILFILFFVLCFPTSVSRLRIIPLYLPILAVIAPNIIKKKLFVSFSVIFCSFILFPLLWATRLGSNELAEYIADYQYGFQKSFSSMDFDTYKTLVYVIAKKFITYGQQLLGCILFWVPRDYWPSKPEGSGHLIAHTYDLGVGEFSNISMNYLGEGYINFGYVGIIVFVIILAYLSARFDKYFWFNKYGNINDPISIYYFSTIGFLFFILRGDMLSGLAYYIGMIVYIYVSEKICFSRHDGISDNSMQEVQTEPEKDCLKT